MTTGTGTTAAIVLLVAALTSCSRSSDESTIRPAATPSPTGQQSTVEDWASLVAQQDQRLDEARQDWDKSLCSGAIKGDPLCSLKFMTLGTVTKTLDVQLQGAIDKDGPAYMGEPPSKVADLVAKTPYL